MLGQRATWLLTHAVQGRNAVRRRRRRHADRLVVLRGTDAAGRRSGDIACDKHAAPSQTHGGSGGCVKMSQPHVRGRMCVPAFLPRFTASRMRAPHRRAGARTRAGIGLWHGPMGPRAVAAAARSPWRRAAERCARALWRDACIKRAANRDATAAGVFECAGAATT